MRLFRFLKELFLPRHEDYYQARLALKADLAWQPYLHVTVWWGVLLTILLGDPWFVPPTDFLDWMWLIGGLSSPILGVFSVWLIRHGTPRQKYVAFWMRLASDIGLLSTVASFEIERLCVLPFTPPCSSFPCATVFEPFVDVILLGVMAFLAVLVSRDIKFLIITERLAEELSGRP